MAENSINNTTIILILIANNKTELSTIAGNLVLWLMYFTICNLHYKTRKQYKRPNGILLSLLLIHKKEDIDRKLDIYLIFALQL